MRELRLGFVGAWLRASAAERASTISLYVVAIGAMFVTLEGSARFTAAVVVFAAVILQSAVRGRSRILAGIAAGGTAETRDMVRVRGMLVADGPGAAATVDEEVARANGWPPEGLIDTRYALTALPTSYLPFGIVHNHFVIESVADQTILGLITLDDRPELSFRPSIGFWLGPQARGRGMAAPALSAFLVLIARTRLPRCYLGTAVENAAMRRVATAAGGTELETSPYESPSGEVFQSVWYQFIPRAPVPFGAALT